VFVFQFRMPVVEVRGFSLVEEARPAIVLNAADGISARVFTLFHEYAHLLTARPGMCIPEEGQAPESKPVEVFCNRVAAAFLIPRADLDAPLPGLPTDEAIAELAMRYRVSRYVVLGRMRALGVVSEHTYQQTRRRWETQAVTAPSLKREQKGGPNRAQRCLDTRGRRFVSVVLEATERGFIPASDANSCLGIRLGDYDTLAAKVK
jgi:Zn-dependent peptidase ImmA (M78 family)